MLDFDLGKLLFIGIVALIFIPPKDLPGALRQLGRLLGQARRLASDFQSQFSEAVRESELDDIKTQLTDLKKSASLEGALERMAEAVEPTPAGPPAPPVSPAATQAYAKSHFVSPAESILPPAPPETTEKAP